MNRRQVLVTGVMSAALVTVVMAGPAGAAGPRDGSGPINGMISSQATLTASQKAALAGMAEEEKLAHDVYVKLYAVNGDVRFSRISESETRHHSAIRTLLSRYGVADPTAGRGVGSFSTPSVQQLYTDLVARGDDSLSAALAVGRDIERMDIADLANASRGVTAPDVLNVYANLSSGSQNHLAAFSR